MLDCSHIVQVDYTAVQGFVGMITDFTLNNVRVALSHMQPEVLEVLEKANVKNLLLAESNDEAIRMLNDAAREEEVGLLDSKLQLENGENTATSPV